MLFGDLLDVPPLGKKKMRDADRGRRTHDGVLLDYDFAVTQPSAQGPPDAGNSPWENTPSPEVPKVPKTV